MKRLRFKFGLASLATAVVAIGLGRAPIPHSLCNFVQSYEAVARTDAAPTVWQRLVYSFALSHQRAAHSKCARGDV